MTAVVRLLLGLESINSTVDFFLWRLSTRLARQGYLRGEDSGRERVVHSLTYGAYNNIILTWTTQCEARIRKGLNVSKPRVVMHPDIGWQDLRPDSARTILPFLPNLDSDQHDVQLNFNLLSRSPFLVLTTCVPRFSQQTYLFSLVFNLLILCRKRDARRYEKRSFGGLQPLTMLMFSQLVGSHTYTPIISTYLGTKTTFFLSGQPL